MSSDSGNKRTTRLAAGASSQLLPKATSNALSKSGISTGSSQAALAPLPNRGRKVTVNFENGSVTLPRGSSVSTSLSVDMKTSAGSDSSDCGGHTQLGVPEDDNDVDDQQSTEPVPSDFDRAVFTLSSPPGLSQDAPVTRSKTRSQALPIDESNLSELDTRVDPIHEVVSLESKLDNKKYRSPPPPPPTCYALLRNRAGEENRTQHTNETDELAEGSDSNPGDESTGLHPKAEALSPSVDDDEYRLPESEDDSPEESIIAEIRGHPKRTANKKTSVPAVKSLRSKDKQADKTRVSPVSTKRVSRSAAGKTAKTQRSVALDRSAHSPKGQGTSFDGSLTLGQNMKAPAEGNDTTIYELIPDSQDDADNKSKPASSLKAKPKPPNVRRPKKPFFPDDLNGQAKGKPTPSNRSIPNTKQNSTVSQGKSKPPASKKKEICGEGTDLTRAQRKRIAPSITQSGKKRQKRSNGETLTVDKDDICVVSHNQAASPIMTSGSKANMSPITLSSDEHPEFTETVHEELLVEHSLNHSGNESSKGSGYLKVNERIDRETEPTSVIKGSSKESFAMLDVPMPAYMPRLGASPVHSDNMKSEATQTEGSEMQSTSDLRASSLLNNFEEMTTPNDATRHPHLNWPRVSDPDGLSRTEHIDRRARNERKSVNRSDNLLSAKASRDNLDVEDLLHPNSRKWAQEIAERERRKAFIPVLPSTTEESGPLTPIMARDSRQTGMSKGEATLKGRRDEVFRSLREVTATVLRHLQSKESITDEIAKTYQQNGQNLINMLLDRQSIELCQIATVFDDKCAQLRKLFEESARHAKRIERRVSNEGNVDFKGRKRGSENLLETVRKAREAVTSI